VRAFGETISPFVRGDKLTSQWQMASSRLDLWLSHAAVCSRGIVGFYWQGIIQPRTCASADPGGSAGDSCDYGDAELWLGGRAERLMFLFTLSAQSAPAELKASRNHPSAGGYRHSLPLGAPTALRRCRRGSWWWVCPVRKGGTCPNLYCVDSNTQ
jgi:hypothetical protein